MAFRLVITSTSAPSPADTSAEDAEAFRAGIAEDLGWILGPDFVTTVELETVEA